MRWCGRAGPQSPNCDVRADGDSSQTPASDRHGDHAVRAGRPWRDRPATEFTLQAWSGGIVGLGRGSADRAPVYVGGQVGEYLAGAYASAATLAFRGARRGELIDLSMLETADPRPYLLSGDLLRDARQAVARRATADGARRRARPRTAWWTLGCGTAQQWFDLCAMTGHEEWIDEDSPLSITEQANEKADELYAWVARPDRRRYPGPGHGVPHPERSGRQRRQRRLAGSLRRRAGSFVTNPRDGFCQPAPPYRMTPAQLRRTATGATPRRAHRRTTARETDIPGRKSAGIGDPEYCFGGGCRSTGFACST